MSQLTARYVICNRPSRSPRYEGRPWCVIDRYTNRIDSRYINPDSAALVAGGLEAIHRGQLDRMSPPVDWDVPKDQEWWRGQDDSYESGPVASPARMGDESFEEPDLAEFRR